MALRAPVSGKVVDLAFHTVGGVVRPGERIMDIVLENDALVVEARVAPQYIDSLHPGRSGPAFRRLWPAKCSAR